MLIPNTRGHSTQAQYMQENKLKSWDTDYTSYEKFRKDYVGKLRRFHNRKFQESNHNTFWGYVVKETNKNLERHEDSKVSYSCNGINLI